MIKSFTKIWTLVFFLTPCALWANRFSSELRVGYFHLFSSVFRDIYKSGGMEYEAQGSVRLCRGLQGWMNFNYFQRSGHSSGLGDKTTVYLCPLSMGLKYDFRLINNFYFYLGMGPSYSRVIVHNDSHFVKKHLSKPAWGWVGKSGFLFFFGRRFFLELYLDYYYTHVSAPHEKRAQTYARDIGGLRTGTGLGITF